MANYPVLSIDHAAFTQGYLVGKRLASLRAKEHLDDVVNATLTDGILYIKNAPASLNNGILEVT